MGTNIDGGRMSSRVMPLVLVVLLGAACSSFTIPRYGLSAENVLSLKKIPRKVSVAGFTAATPGRFEIACRGRGYVRTPDDRPFEDYIRRALVEELKIAEVLSDSAAPSLTGNLTKLDFNSMTGEWVMDMVVTSSNGRSLTLSSVYEYSPGPRFSFTTPGTQEERACAQTAQAFPVAVQVLI